MIRLLIFLAVVVVLGMLFSWVADRPGDVIIQLQGQEYQLSLMVAVTAIVAVIAAVMIAWAIISTILRSPAIMSRFFKGRKKDRGYSSLSKGLIAASSGDVATARRLAKESEKLLENEPLVKLLDAQTSLLEGNRDQARERYAEMLDDDRTKLVGLRGLYLEAEREGVKDAARHYADEAVGEAPALQWACEAKLQFQAADNQWEEALKTLEANRAAGLIDKQEASYKRAVLLTALAYQEEGANPTKAAKHAQAAHKLAPDLVPAAVIGAQAYARNNDVRRGSKLIESVWKKTPHPALADAYVHLRAGDSVQDRLARAEKLAALRSNHPEGAIAVAQAAIDAQDWVLAREKMQSILITNLTERACLIMADIEEGESGDQGRMRDWLSRAVRAPRDPIWTADGYTSETWMPVSPVTGEIGAFEWKVPTERLDEGPDAIEIGDLAQPLVLETGATLNASPKAARNDHDEDGESSVERALAGAGMAAGATVIDAKAEDIEDAEVVEVEAKDEATDDAASKADDEAASADASDDKPDPDVKEVAVEPDEVQEITPAKEKDDTAVETEGEADKDGDKKPSGKGQEGNKVDFPLDRRPDDPGVRPEYASDNKSEKKRFGLF